MMFVELLYVSVEGELSNSLPVRARAKCFVLGRLLLLLYDCEGFSETWQGSILRKSSCCTWGNQDLVLNCPSKVDKGSPI